MKLPPHFEPEDKRGNPRGEPLSEALRSLLRDPGHHLLAAWNWKAALVSATLRATMFLLADRQAGAHRALKAGLVEASFAVLAAGLLAAVTQRLRWAKPAWITSVVVWLGLPALLIPVQWLVHRAAGTAHVRAGLWASFCFAAVASGFTWSAQRHGILLAGLPEASGAARSARTPSGEQPL